MIPICNFPSAEVRLRRLIKLRSKLSDPSLSLPYFLPLSLAQRPSLNIQLDLWMVTVSHSYLYLLYWQKHIQEEELNFGFCECDRGSLIEHSLTRRWGGWNAQINVFFGTKVDMDLFLFSLSFYEKFKWRSIFRITCLSVKCFITFIIKRIKN